ncbi:MAG: hypothetical protein SFT81_07430 [Candidatus Caenarcaniphilales bacterium]|nr:hypothetical protein [Candidatus Caenarcaniphilales bacterium]
MTKALIVGIFTYLFVASTLPVSTSISDPYPPELYGIKGFEIPAVPEGCNCPPPRPEICPYTYRPVPAKLFNKYCDTVHNYIKCPVYYCSQPNPALLK